VEHNVPHLVENMQSEPVDSHTSTFTDPIQSHLDGKGEEKMNMKRGQASGSRQVSTANEHARERDRTNTPSKLNAQGKRKYNAVSDEDEDAEWPTSRRRVNTRPQGLGILFWSRSTIPDKRLPYSTRRDGNHQKPSISLSSQFLGKSEQ
jgi:hypothetical protein